MHLVRPPRGLNRVAVLAHGSGSTAEFVRRAFGDALAEAGVRLVAVDDRSGALERVAAGLASAVDAFRAAGSGEVLVGGVSLGAHAAAVVAAGRPWLAGVLLALPAWTGPPSKVAALSTAAGHDLERNGVPDTLKRLDGRGWVAAELAVAWPMYAPGQLARALAATGRSAGPTPAQLAAIEAPTGLFAEPDDPFHPDAVARSWAELVRRSYVVVERVDPVDGARDLGRQSVRAWLAAERGSAPDGPHDGVA